MMPIADKSPSGLVTVTMPEEAITYIEAKFPGVEFRRIPLGDGNPPEYILRAKPGFEVEMAKATEGGGGGDG